MDERILYQSNKAELQSPDERWMTMSLASPGKPTLDNQKSPPKPYSIKVTNRVNDIEGAFAKNHYDKWPTKDVMSYVVPGANSPTRTHARNVADLSLCVDDIEGARFYPVGGMERTKRNLNPLNPKYSLPSYTVPINTFDQLQNQTIRDPLFVGDIDGVSSNAFSRNQTRDIISVSDIPGASANFEHRAKQELLMRTFGPGMEYTQRQDMTHVELHKQRFQDRSRRCIDVMNPVYQYNGMEISDDPIKCKPRLMPQYVPGGTYSLVTTDIVGATPGKLKDLRFKKKEYRNIMSTQDVVGAQADTVKHSITSTRITCPLSPVYRGLNHGEPIGPITAPLIDATSMGKFGPASLRYLKRSNATEVNVLAHLSSPISRRPSASLLHSPPLSHREIERQRDIESVRELGC